MAASGPRFALNHMAAPRLSVAELFDLARDIGVTEVEIRNDLAGNAILDGTPAGEVKRQATAAGVTIVSINALQRFNEWTVEREREAVELADYAQACGASALVLVPVNDGSGRANGERQGNLRLALKALKTILSSRGIAGLVEPLGFEICSLRSKQEAADAIRAIGAEETFRLVHDTFHHYLAGQPAVFPEMTGLVHISGVTEAAVSVADMRDPHRVLVDSDDRLGNIAQIRALLAGGYAGPFSFEPFALAVHALASPGEAVAASIDFITAELARTRASSAQVSA
jgi:2-keto-myo-inositol isomerase